MEPQPVTPAKPTKVEPGSETAVSTTGVFCVNVMLQSTPQSMPLGMLVTRPVPAPVMTTST